MFEIPKKSIITFKDRLKLLFVPMKEKFINNKLGIWQIKWKTKNNITYVYKCELIFKPDKEVE